MKSHEESISRNKEEVNRDYKGLMDALEDVLNGKIEILSSNSRGLSSHGGV